MPRKMLAGAKRRIAASIEPSLNPGMYVCINSKIVSLLNAVIAIRSPAKNKIREYFL